MRCRRGRRRRGEYLDAAAIVAIAIRSGAEAIHPGYGFLSESPTLAAACARSDVVFVGPPPGVAELMADKWMARIEMASLGVPVLPGEAVQPDDSAAIRGVLESIGLPLIVKPTDGGGGIGMQKVTSAARGGGRDTAGEFPRRCGRLAATGCIWSGCWRMCGT